MNTKEDDVKKKAVVLSSGGVDSTTTIAIAIAEGFDVYSLTFDYGQRHAIEVGRARMVAKAMGAAEHKWVVLGLRNFAHSALTVTDAEIPKGRTNIEMATAIPATYVPARNAIFLSCALAYAETIGAQDIFLGINAIDYSGYPDARPEFLEAFQTFSNFATKFSAVDGGRFKIHAPLIHMGKKEIIETGLRLGVDYSITLSCYDPDEHGIPCGECDSCILRAKGFREAGIDDPALVKGA